jgi:DNA-binding response OmpR family regulator
MKILIVEDDFLTRHLLQSFLTPYGSFDITVNGLEAIKAFEMALDEKAPYDLICLRYTHAGDGWPRCTERDPADRADTGNSRTA